MPTTRKLLEDIVAGYGAFIKQVYAAGCRNLQLDDCSWGVLVDPRAELFFGADQEGLKRIKALLLEINNRVLDAAPADLTINTHVCRGNFHSTWACEGGYDDVADALLAQEHVNAFFLEFDDHRSGGFEPLASVPAGKKVVAWSGSLPSTPSWKRKPRLLSVFMRQLSTYLWRTSVFLSVWLCKLRDW